jgi:hypothetical protein
VSNSSLLAFISYTPALTHTPFLRLY